MSDYISRADAIEAVCDDWCGYPYSKCPHKPQRMCDGCDTIEVLRALPSVELPKGDLISRADVLKYPIRLDHYDEVNGNRLFVYGVESVIEYVESLPPADAVSREDYEDIIKDYRKQYENMNNEIADLEAKLLADAVPTVIRAKTFMRKEDFDKWAEDIKKQNKSIVCIPCDAEVVSADAVEVDRTSEWVAVRREEYEDLIADAEQVTGKLKKPCDSLLTDDSAECKEHKSKLESADAVHGEWIPIEETLPTYDGGEKTWLTGMKCSNCGKLFDLRVGYYYCPNCGTRMKGGAE